MSDYHILSADTYGNRYQVVMHFPVADQDNEVGYSYRTAIVEWQTSVETPLVQSTVPFITGTELTQLQAGEVYERAYLFNSNPNETLAQKQARLDAMYTANQAAVQDEVGKVLGFWGHNRDVP